MKKERYVQIGETALRDPVTREFLPSVPLYVREEDIGEEAEAALAEDIAGILARKFQAYRQGCRRAAV